MMQDGIEDDGHLFPPVEYDLILVSHFDGFFNIVRYFLRCDVHVSQ